ncbi:MAG: PEP-CTERM sorting domain-containing protein [Planctomycetaceae bacterium]
MKTSKLIRRRVGLGGAFACMLAAAVSGTAPAQVTTVDVNNAANWTTGTGAGANSSVTYGFDYSTVGIPQAPGSSNTLAMVLRSNTNTSVSAAQGITVSPNGVNLTGDYIVRAMIWGNTIGGWTTGAALSASTGATQFVGLGVGYTGGTLWRAGATTGGGSGVWFSSAIEGGFGGASATLRDYSAFTGSGAVAGNFVTATTAYFANASGTIPQDNNNPYYQTAFPGQVVNTINGGAWATIQNQTALTGTTTNGVPGMAWREYTIARTGSTVTWSISGTPIATLSGTGLTLDGATSLTYFDATAGVATSPNLVFGLVSSYSVEVVPEPSSIALTVVGISGAGVVAHRRRRRRQVSAARG